jgi:hypothetical protein
VIYQSEIEPEFDGDVEVDPIGIDFASDTEITLAQFIKVSGYHELNDQWALLGLLSSMEDTSVARWSERALQRIRPPVQKHFFNFPKE